MVIIAYKSKGVISRVGLYEKDTMKWVKWLPKKIYKQYALAHGITIIEM